MKKYEMPDIEIVRFDTADVVTSSSIIMPPVGA